jgi:uncharacterized membrane protein YphA (DoxX/SURF4 family)
MKNVNAISKVFQIIIGILFLVSGVMKAIDAQYFASLLVSYGLGSAGILAPVVSGIEIILGTMMLLSLDIQRASLIIALLTTLFSIIFAYAYLYKGIDDCGCFGAMIKIHPEISLVKNIFIISGCAWIYRFTQNEAPVKIRRWKIYALTIIGCIFFYIGGLTLVKPFINKNHIKPGDNIHSSALRYYTSKNGAGMGLIFIFSPDCPHCWNATENVKSIKNIPQFSNTIGITFPGGDLTRYTATMTPNFEIFEYPTAELGEVINEVPLLIIYENGVVKKIYSSDEIPCGQMLALSISH